MLLFIENKEKEPVKPNEPSNNTGNSNPSRNFDAPEITTNKKGELTNYINVYRTKTGYVHGCPGNP